MAIFSVKIGLIINKNDLAWNEKFSALEEFKKIHGHCKVGIGYKHGKIKLGSWLHDQKKFVKPRKYENYQRNAMPQYRRERLDALCPDWQNPRVKRKN